MRKVAPFSEILSRIQEFPLRKVGVYPKESPSLHRVNSQLTKNREKRTSDSLKKEEHSENPSDLPYSSETPVFIGVSRREVFSGDLPKTSHRPPV